MMLFFFSGKDLNDTLCMHIWVFLTIGVKKDVQYHLYDRISDNIPHPNMFEFYTKSIWES